MTQLVNVMIDLETFGVNPGCVVTQIGACSDSPMSEPLLGYNQPDFLVNVDAGDAQRSGLVIEAGAVMWWLEQSEEARQALIRRDNVCSLRGALERFSLWFRYATEGREFLVWASPANFDFPIIRAAYRVAGVACPWEWHQERCLRTLKKTLYGIPAVEFEGTAHNAVDDAKHQMKQLKLVLEMVTPRLEEVPLSDMLGEEG